MKKKKNIKQSVVMPKLLVLWNMPKKNLGVQLVGITNVKIVKKKLIFVAEM